MNIVSAQFLAGANVHHHDSVLVISFDPGPSLRAANTATVAEPIRLAEGVPEALRELEDIWRDAARRGCTPIEAMLLVALALQRDLTVRPAAFGKVLGATGEVMRVALRCEVPAVGLAAWEVAAASGRLFGLAVTDPARLPGLLKDTWEAHARFHERAAAVSLDQLTLAMLRAADARGIPWYRLGFPHLMVQLGQGRYARRLHETMLETTSYFAVRLCSNKAATHQLLQRLGFPLPAQHLVHGADQAIQAAAAIGYPVVVKPCHGGKGRGVSVGLGTQEQVRQAYLVAARSDDSVVVESLLAGADHRLLVVAGRFLAAARRLPASVVGDGRSTIAELVVALNRDPRRGRDYQKLMEMVDIDQEIIDVLARQGHALHSVLPSGARALLRRTANVSRGGTAEDVTGIIHADNVRLAEDVARAVGLDVAGIDFLTPDISRSWRDVGGGVIEVNPNPGLRPHWIDNPRQRDVVGPILDLLFPPLATARIPTVGITGSIGKTSTCRMVAHILAAAGKRVGLATTQGTWVGGHQVKAGDYAGGNAATNLMLHRDVEAGVFELARGGLIRAGMGLDRFDVGAVLNVLDNHLGLDGIDSREQMARVKRIVAENCDELAVLNADDPLCLAMREHVRSHRLCLFSRDPAHPELVAHAAAGGCTLSMAGDDAAARIVLAEGRDEVGTLDIRDIPATLGGASIGKAVNAAFALAIAHGLGVSFACAAAALRNFASTAETNPGRLNLIPDLPFTALLDWADGPVANAELAAVARKLSVKGRRWLLLTAVGNRPDDFIVAAARAHAGHFEGYICSNYSDLRGRSADEVPSLLCQGLMDGGVAEERIRCIADHELALDQAMATAGKDDLLAIAGYATDLVLRRLLRRRT